MKQFILALLLLALTVALTVANAMTIRKDVAHLTELAEQDDVDRLCEELKRLDNYFSLTVNHNLLEQVQQNAHAMRAYRGIDEMGNADYQMAKENLLLLLQEIEDGERCSFFNIF
ncbi:MAG: hypothetical protein J1E00_08350 [Oscillospiraceae bacterium]|nr:hypothetical protein [Oscillospiraceae bacterium]